MQGGSFYLCLLLTLCAVLFSSCTLGPKYVKPEVDLPNHWPGLKKIKQYDSKKINLAWWEGYHDPILNSLIKNLSAVNLDLKLAVNRIDQAKAEYEVVTGEAVPVIEFGGLILQNHNENASLNIPVIPLAIPLSKDSSVNQAVFNLSWELDLFGKLRNERSASKAHLEATINERASIHLSLISNVLKYYIELRGFQARKAIMKENLNNNEVMVKLLNVRYESGLNGYSLVDQQKIASEQDRAQLELIDAQINNRINQIELLTGQKSGSLTHLLSPVKPIPFMETNLSLDAPACVLSRRPDIAAAERQVAAANASVGAAIANLMPRIGLGALMGWQELSLYNFINNNGEVVRYAATLALPFLNISAHKMIKFKKMKYLEMAINYHKTVLSAVNEISIYYRTYQHQRKRFTHYKYAINYDNEAIRLNKNRYQRGIINYIDFLQEKQRSNQLRLEYINSKEELSISLIEVFKAVGGGI